MCFMNKDCHKWGQVRISEHSKGTHNGRRGVGMGNVEMPKAMVSMLIVLQIPIQLLLAQWYSLCIIVFDKLLILPTTSKIMFSGFESVNENHNSASKKNGTCTDSLFQ